MKYLFYAAPASFFRLGHSFLLHTAAAVVTVAPQPQPLQPPPPNITATTATNITNIPFKCYFFFLVSPLLSCVNGVSFSSFIICAVVFPLCLFHILSLPLFSPNFPSFLFNLHLSMFFTFVLSFCIPYSHSVHEADVQQEAWPKVSNSST
jgi:hypothetical protein